VVVLHDGDLPGLLATARALEEAAAEDLPLPLVIVSPDQKPSAAVVGAARRDAELSGLDVVEVDGSGSVVSIWLLQACLRAASAGRTRVVWPAQPLGAESTTQGLGGLATVLDQATLVGRLVDVERGAPGFEVETPFADLCDGQIAELAADLGVDVSRCWWWGSSGSDAADSSSREARGERARWREAFASVDLEHFFAEAAPRTIAAYDDST